MSSQKITTPYVFQEHDLVMAAYEGKPYILKVKDLEEGDKPRERMLKHGANALSTTELLAVILGAGTKKEEVMQMSHRILREYGEKNISNQTRADLLSRDLDIPLVKACQIVACFELGKRFLVKKPGRTVTVRTAKQAYHYLRDMRTLPKEHLRGLYLNSRYEVIHDEVISVGTLTSSIIHPREVFRPALEYAAAAVILAHNHPSGDPTPTQSDIETTKHLVEAAKVMGIDLLDHIIIAGNKFSSIEVPYE